MSKAFMDVPCILMNGERKTLADFGARAVLVVNTASQCGFTPQYKGLEHLWQQWKGKGLLVIGFPCNQFGHQEPADDRQIAQFCDTSFGVSFPLCRKVEVNGDHAHRLFAELKAAAPGLMGSQRIKWNFTKFLIDTRSGQVQRFAPFTKPDKLEGELARLLG
ncbi:MULTISPECIES: glutathione peroxidase [unclassified Pseudomonas]|uniref:glutathione peroxidase n=1 Tax=unclassified Pseudomonas TaxID=196821 RepID=UPI000BD39BF6|nr:MULTISPECIES: glutathione peroxidase [unclassified Pseudomonas]PVZ09234.1 glutathione peroxidase [Pseudomonas sp. URIL14HWK12:I12]PVZ21321.1 glutathione peroxidase [Pseudomonas sp. URIL14HWK12:I10]PVZ30174.1 glutathione peroxidase [Pseudomonas sp. URIL14HWK12:I11]SNZ18710.1 glutathione peroxidase [Pseudomonas sp. URIL14HWK12:I9]